MTEKYRPWLSLQGAAALVQQQVGPDKNHVADALVRAAAEITEAAAKVEKTVPRIMQNQLGSSLANATAARKAIARIIDPAVKRANEAADYANSAINSLTEKSSPAMPDDVMGAMAHQEVRAVVRMNNAERRKAIATAIASGDETFIAAATTGSPALSGMTSAEQAVAREQWRTKRHPETAEHIKRLRGAVARLDQLAPMLGKWGDSLVLSGQGRRRRCYRERRRSDASSELRRKVFAWPMSSALCRSFGRTSRQWRTQKVVGAPSSAGREFPPF